MASIAAIWRKYSRLLSPPPPDAGQTIHEIQCWREALRTLSSPELTNRAAQLRQKARDGAERLTLRTEAYALAGEAVRRTLGLTLYDEQIYGAVVLSERKIAEMQTGEGKTVTAVLPVFLQALTGEGAHVLTANDYLARRDAEWMGGVYGALGLSSGYVVQGMTAEDRRAAYVCDVTYLTANEAGFDLLRDSQCLFAQDRVHRPFHFALIDEADSILIDEARIPLVIAGGRAGLPELARRMNTIAALFQPGRDFTYNEHQRIIQITPHGARLVEANFPCENLYAEQNGGLYTAIYDALHARTLLRRDVDYVVRDNAIELIDEWKGRIADRRRWPAGLHAALEAKEELPLTGQGFILGSLTLQNLVGLYPALSGMTGTARTQAAEFLSIYGLEVVPVPTHRPCIRRDEPDIVFGTRREKNLAIVSEIGAAQQQGRPVLAGSGSVEESEQLSALLHAAGVPHRVLNARNDSEEAAIIAQAGQVGSVTISTNMAGRGADIPLGEGAAALGGLYVIGANRHESRRIDHQLRGRAGRQGDPGSSRFFVSLEDDLMARFGADPSLIGRPPNDPAASREIEHIQRVVEGENFEIRRLLWKYEGLIEMHRREFCLWRDSLLEGEGESSLAALDPELFEALLQKEGPERLREAERIASLVKGDELWCDYLAAVYELKAGAHWRSWGGRDPLHEFLFEANAVFDSLRGKWEEELLDFFRHRLASDEESDHWFADLLDRGATWTYMTTDQPLGDLGERIAKGIQRKLRSRKLWT